MNFLFLFFTILGFAVWIITRNILKFFSNSVPFFLVAFWEKNGRNTVHFIKAVLVIVLFTIVGCSKLRTVVMKMHTNDKKTYWILLNINTGFIPISAVPCVFDNEQEIDA